MRRITLTCLLAAFAAPLCAQQPQPAGEIRTLVPAGQIQRAGVVREAKRSDPVFWADVLRTDRNGRARVGLLDGSILNVGAESQLQISKHDATSQQTELDLAYGRLRANVTKLVKPSASFRVRTLVANAGVVGTRFVVRALLDHTEILCLEGTVRVRNRDESVAGEVTLQAGEFTRVVRGQPPTPASPASDARKREAENETDLPAAPQLSRVEISWPPAGCGEGAELLLRGWAKQMVEGREVESPVDAELLTGTLRLGGQSVHVEGGRARLESAPRAKPAEGAFTPRDSAAPAQTKLWDPLPVEPGEGWRAPRAVFAGNAFYVLGPMGFTTASFTFGSTPATLLWQGPCGAGFLAPPTPVGESDVTLSLSGAAVARGKMNLIGVSYRMPVPPSVLRGQETSFGMDLRGLEGLERMTAGRPILVVELTNQTPAIIGNLRTSTSGARASGETITWIVQGSAAASGTARLDATARGRIAGAYNIGVNVKLDEALEKPRTPLAPAARP